MVQLPLFSPQRGHFMKQLLAAAVTVFALAALPEIAAASTQFLAYEGRDAIQEGQGGNKKVVDGVDFWIFGAPPHRFQVLGMLQDERWKSGLYGLVRVSNLEHDIAKTVRAAGGDAVILEDQHDKAWGLAGSSFGGGSWSGNGWGGSWSGSSFSTVHPYGTKELLYVVVKYLPDEPAGGAGVAPPEVARAPSSDPPKPASHLAQEPPPAPAPEQPQSCECGMVRQADGALKLAPCKP